MNNVLKQRLLEESKVMLAESRKALLNFDAHLSECIVDVEHGAGVHPVRHTTQRTVLGLNVIQKAVESHETRKRTLAEAQEDGNIANVHGGPNVPTQEEHVPVSRGLSDLALSAQIAEDEERVKADLERAEMLRIEADKAEQRRLQVERALEEERAVLTRIERERAELKLKLAAEQEELAKERAEMDRTQKVAREEKEKRELEVLEAKRLADEAETTQHLALKAAEAKRVEGERMEAERLEKLRVEKEEEEERERLAKEENERLEREWAENERLENERTAQERLENEREEQEQVRLEQERVQKEQESLEKERLKQEEEARQEAARLAASAVAVVSVPRALPAGEDGNASAVQDGEEDDAERALQEALAEKAILEESIQEAGDEQEEEEYQMKSNISERPFDAEVDQADSNAPVHFAEKKYVTISDYMLQPIRIRLGLSRTLKKRVLVLREDKFRYYDESQSKMLGGLSLADEGVEVVLTAIKKSPSGLSLRFSSPATGMLEFYPENEEVGRKWIKAVEHNLEMRYELPDMGPEEALTYYDYLGVQPDLADSSTLLQAYADKTRSLRDEALKHKLDEALQVLNDPFKRVEYDNFVTVQRKYRFGAPATVQIKTPRGESTDAIASRVFTDATFSYLYWQDVRLGASLTGRHLCVELVRIQEVQPGSASNAVNLLLNNGEILIFLFKEKREAEDFGAAVRFAKSPQLSSAKRRQSVVETSV